MYIGGSVRQENLIRLHTFSEFFHPSHWYTSKHHSLTDTSIIHTFHKLKHNCSGHQEKNVFLLDIVQKWP